MPKDFLVRRESSSNVSAITINLLSKNKPVVIASQFDESDSSGMVDSVMCSGVVSRALFVLTMCLN